MTKTPYGNEEHSSDDCSSCSYVDYDINMTEEEAMAIWLQRNEEIGERVRRREAAEEAQRQALGEEQQLPRSSSPKDGSSDGDESIQSGQCDSVGSGDTNSGFRHAAAVTHSDAWNRAISCNVMGEYDPHNTDPAYQNAYHAYQRFVDLNQPGVADNFIASTPGLASLMEQRRHLMATQRLLDLQLQQMQKSSMISSCHNNDAAQSSPSSSAAAAAAAPSHQDQGNDSMSKSHLPPHLRHESFSSSNIIKSEDGESITRISSPEGGMLSAPPPPRSTRSCSSNNSSQVSAAASAQILEYTRISQAYALNKSDENSGKGTTLAPQAGYFYAFIYPTQYNSKGVTCPCCRMHVYTNPLAVNMFCQSCGRLSRVGGDDDLESRWEGKMQEVEDMDMGC